MCYTKRKNNNINCNLEWIDFLLLAENFPSRFAHVFWKFQSVQGFINRSIYSKHASFRRPMPLMYLFSWYILYNHIFKLRTFNTIPEYQVVPGISGQCRSRRHYIGSILAVHVTTLHPYAQWPVGRTQYGIGASRVTSIKL